jgi:hypothetical protein
VAIAVLTPSRGRPDRLDEMLDAIKATAQLETTAIFVGLDVDDEFRYPQREGVWYIVKERMRLGAWANELAKVAWDDYEILASFGDDHRPRTPGWDVRIEQEFLLHGSGLVYGADGLQDARLPTAPFWSTDIVKTLGWYFPPNLVHLFADDFWLAFAKAIGRCRYIPEILIEHLHPSAGKAEWDAINHENDSWWEHDQGAYQDYLNNGFRSDVERVLGIL